MHDHNAALDQVIRETAAIFGVALVRLLFPRPAYPQADFPETESPHVTAG